MTAHFKEVLKSKGGNREALKKGRKGDVEGGSEMEAS